MSTPIRSGIPTTYAGSRFRSRLEARWAAFFDLIDWRYTYEPFDTEGYIPDFLIHGASPLLVEVGPCEVLTDFIAKAEKPIAAFGVERPVLVVGVHPLILESGQSFFGDAGYLSTDGWRWPPDVAGWSQCRDCGLYGVYHTVGSYKLLPCGHADGDHFLGPIDAGRLELLWRDAGNRVQWRAA